MLLKVKGGWKSFLTYLLKIAFRACLLEPGLKLIFHWCTQWLTFANLLLNPTVQLFILCTTDKNEVLLANDLALDDDLSGRSFMYIKKN